MKVCTAHAVHVLETREEIVYIKVHFIFKENMKSFFSKCLVLEQEHTGKIPTSKSYYKGQPNKYKEIKRFVTKSKGCRDE